MAAIDTKEAKEVRNIISSLRKDDYKLFFETLSFFGNYMPGTHVAGIVAAVNPAARILPVRLTFGHEMIPDEPTLDETIRGAESMMATVEYFKAVGVRVVNMNWGGAPPLAAGSLSAAVVMTLDPGSYTAKIAGAGDTTGVAIIEAYEID